MPHRGLSSREGKVERMGSTDKSDSICLQPIGTKHRALYAELVHVVVEKKKARKACPVYGDTGTFWKD